MHRKIKGIAKGIRVLHTMDDPVAHRDAHLRLQSNVLIDDDSKPLIADFRMAKV